MTRWDPSATNCLPEYMKGVYMILYDTVNEMSREAEKAQGRDTLDYARRAVWKLTFHTFICGNKYFFVITLNWLHIYLGSDYWIFLCVQWEDCIGSFMQEAKWIATGYLPTFEEYYENGKVSSAHRLSALQPMLTMDIPFPPHILKEVDFPSKLNDLACVVLLLRGDTRCYKVLPIKSNCKKFLLHVAIHFWFWF